MPPDVVHTSLMRSFLYIVLSLACGAAIALAGIYFFAKSPNGQALLRNFLVAESLSAPATTLSLSASSTAPTVPMGTLLVPKSYATQDYFVAINSIVQDIFAINSTNDTLGSVLEALNKKTLSCSYAGFYEDMGKAHQLANKNQTLISQLTFHMTALAAANTQTKDAITKANTQTLIDAGSALVTSLQAYASGVNSLLIGDTPTSAQIAEFQSQVNAATGASKLFADALDPLMRHILEGDQALMDTASSTPAKK